MNRTRCLQLGLALAAFSICNAGAQNLLKNGDIEILKEGQPVGWFSKIAAIESSENMQTAEADFSVVPDPGGKRGNVLHVAYKSGEARALWAQQDINADQKLKAGRKYEFSLWVKYNLKHKPKKNQASVTARWNVWEEGFYKISELYATPVGNLQKGIFAKLKGWKTQSDWEQLKIVFELPASKSPKISAIYVALAGVPGELWADDFQLKEVDAGTPVSKFED